MPYTPHLWKARLGTGLNQFLNSGTLQNLILTPNPTSITQEGTPFNVDWMNELEQGVADVSVLLGTSDPATSTVGAVGQLYVNTSSLELFMCTDVGTVYTWVSIVVPPFAIGDILTTVRTDLGDKWLLCNGDEVSAHDYSELVELFPTLHHVWVENDLWNSSNSDTRINIVTYVNGYWVAGGLAYESSTYYARIAYTTDITGTWTTKNLWSSGSGVDNYINCITYANGYWVAGGCYYTGNTYYARIAYTTDITGTWTTKDLWSASSAGYISSVTYANGYWVAGGRAYEDYARIAYTTDLSGTWTTKNLWTGASQGYIKSIIYANGYWVAAGMYTYGSYYVARIAYTTDITGTWTTKDLWQSTVDNYINCIAYANGYWVVGGSYYNSSTYYARIAYTTDITGTWTTKDLWSCESSGTADINCITYANGDWVAVGVCYNSSTYYARIAYTTDLSGTWTTKDLWSGSTISRLNSVTYANGYWVVGGVYSKSISFSTSTYYARIAYTDPNKVTLPTISADNSYAYIKAKG